MIGVGATGWMRECGSSSGWAGKWTVRLSGGGGLLPRAFPGARVGQRVGFSGLVFFVG